MLSKDALVGKTVEEVSYLDVWGNHTSCPDEVRSVVIRFTDGSRMDYEFTWAFEYKADPYLSVTFRTPYRPE